MPIIGPVLVRIHARTLCLNHTLTSIAVFARHSSPLSTYPCYKRICHTIAAHMWYCLQLLMSRPSMPITASRFFSRVDTQHQRPLPLIYQPSHIHLVSLTSSLHQTAMRQPITNFRVVHSRCCALAGLSTPLAVVTSRPPS